MTNQLAIGKLTISLSTMSRNFATFTVTGSDGKKETVTLSAGKTVDTHAARLTFESCEIKIELLAKTKEEKALAVLSSYAEQRAVVHEWIAYSEGSPYAYNSDPDILLKRMEEPKAKEAEILAAVNDADKKNPQVRKLLAQLAGFENRYEGISAQSNYGAVIVAARKAIYE